MSDLYAGGELEQLVLLQDLERQIKRNKDVLKQRLLSRMRMGDTSTAWIGDVRIGQVTYAAGKKSVTVGDTDTFLQWVAETDPDQIVQAVNPDHVARVLNRVSKTGEPVPGVEIHTGGGYLTTSVTDDAGPVSAELWERYGVELIQIRGGDA